MPTSFISTQDLTDYLGRNVTADPGAVSCVDAACDFCRDISEQTFNRGTTTEVFDGTGTDALLLPDLPVNSIGTVEVLNGAWTTAGSADYTLNSDGMLLATDTAGTSGIGCTWPRGRQNVRVTYDHGYTIGTAGNVPASVRMVALAAASRMFLQGPILSENLGDQAIRYAAESTALMSTERAILRKYRRAR